MKRRKVIIFFSVMFITAGTLFATASKYKHYKQNHKCGSEEMQQTKQANSNATDTATIK